MERNGFAVMSKHALCVSGCSKCLESQGVLGGVLCILVSGGVTGL